MSPLEMLMLWSSTRRTLSPPQCRHFMTFPFLTSWIWIHGVIAASPGENLAHTNSFQTLCGWSLLLSVVLKLHPSEKNFSLPRLCSWQHTGGQPKPFLSVLHPSSPSKIHPSNSLPGWKSRPRGRKSTCLVSTIGWQIWDEANQGS